MKCPLHKVPGEIPRESQGCWATRLVVGLPWTHLQKGCVVQPRSPKTPPSRHMTKNHRQGSGKSTPAVVLLHPCYPHDPGGGAGVPSVFLLLVGSSGSWLGRLRSPCNWVFCSSVSEIPKLCTKDSTAIGICSGSLVPPVNSPGAGVWLMAVM